jgi:hypothetical protein
MQGAGFAPKAHKQAVSRPFDQALKRGKEWEWKVYSLLKDRFPDIRKPLTYEEALGYLDKAPDMSVRGLAVQCKRRDFDFTGPHDFPFSSFYIDEEYKLQSDYIPDSVYRSMPVHEKRRNLRQFLAYFTANASMTHLGVVIPGTKEYWFTETCRLRRDDRSGTSWACPLNKVLWLKIEDFPTILTRF